MQLKFPKVNTVCVREHIKSVFTLFVVYVLHIVKSLQIFVRLYHWLFSIFLANHPVTQYAWLLAS